MTRNTASTMPCSSRELPARSPSNRVESALVVHHGVGYRTAAAADGVDREITLIQRRKPRGGVVDVLVVEGRGGQELSIVPGIVKDPEGTRWWAIDTAPAAILGPHGRVLRPAHPDLAGHRRRAGGTPGR